ncbi:unnamed protein product [Diatraea saccharalis]|uniref:Gamma-interferon-inducible lysosomal thiol reductase n=1 Tax=Diatraea saccharalis TaxID=40085 RepID=A0A9N9WFJ2_9NEOP|nr:unnamed protein product [Diatraea saccharalis]
MRSLLILFVLAVCYGVLAKNKKPDDRVKIAVYYESLCPDSKKFITEQLAPVWHELRGAIKVKLVPYGKSTHSQGEDKWNIMCHHGPDECHGNKVQACILRNHSLLDTDKMALIICLMGQAQPDKALDTCLAQVKKESVTERLKHCSDGPEGDAILANNGDKTARVQRPLAFVPTIIINEKFDQANQDEALTNLKAVVCRNAVTKPASC